MKPELRIVGGIANPRHPTDVLAAKLVQGVIDSGARFVGAAANGLPQVLVEHDNEVGRAAVWAMRAFAIAHRKTMERALWEALITDRFAYDAEVYEVLPPKGEGV